MQYITLVVITKNRAEQLKKCLASIDTPPAKAIDLIIVDQSTHRIEFTPFHYFHSLSYISSNTSGKSRGLNIALHKNSNSIIAFTDDDCLPDNNWINVIQASFHQFPEISIVFGKTLPYKPKDHQEQFCPSTFTKTDMQVYSNPVPHWQNYGFGNNMAFRKEIFDKLGLFKPWLGPGSIGSNAEDAEMSLRALIYGYKILYNPQMVVYHNKWLTEEGMKKQNLSYTCGEMACYGYFAFQGHLFSKPIVKNNMLDLYYRLRKIVKKTIYLKINSVYISELRWLILDIVYRLRGLFVGFIYSITDPIKK